MILGHYIPLVEEMYRVGYTKEQILEFLARINAGSNVIILGEYSNNTTERAC